MRRVKRKTSFGKRSVGWVLKSLAPWAMGGCLLLSFTASAGPRSDALEFVLRRHTLNDDVQVAMAPPAAESEDAAAALLLFGENAPGLAASPMSEPGRFGSQLSAIYGRFSASGHEGATGAVEPGAVAPQDSPDGASPMRPQPLDETSDGSTPLVPRSVSLASATPVPAEPEPAAAPKRVAGFQQLTLPSRNAPLPPQKPVLHAGYADLIEPGDMAREQRCLAEAIYFEARSEPPSGQAAVAQVVLNRVKSGLYPDTVCGVVYQNRHRYLGCQFTFACEGRSLQITEPGPWRQAVKVAQDVTFGRTYLPAVGNATHYHADYVRPSWSRLFTKKDTIGRHTFYRPRPGQT